VRIHLLLSWSEQAQVFSLEGHRWPFEPARPGSNLVSSRLMGGMEALTFVITESAGGPGRLGGDYVYGNHREAYHEAGQWGIFRVYDRSPAKLRPLGSPTPSN
jgi:manganese oxidase